MPTTVDTLTVDKTVGVANSGSAFRLCKAIYYNLANGASSGNSPVTVTLKFNNPLPNTNYAVKITASQACFASYANKTTTGVDIVLTADDGIGNIFPGTFDVEISWFV